VIPRKRRKYGEKRNNSYKQILANISKYFMKGKSQLRKNISCNMEVRNVQENLGINVSLMLECNDSKHTSHSVI